MKDLKHGELTPDDNRKSQGELLNERMQGKLPTINIAGHIFYVDVRMNSLRPHNDFTTFGIHFARFDDHKKSDEVAWIPYDPKKHEAKDVDFSEIKEIPKDWVMVEIPNPWRLDPYGYAVKHGYPIAPFLKEFPIQESLKARIVPWKESGILEVIRKNNIQPDQSQASRKAEGPKLPEEDQRRKGRSRR